MLRPEYLFLWILFHLGAVELPKSISKRGQVDLTATKMVDKMQYYEAIKVYKSLEKVKSSNELRSLGVAFMEMGQNDTAYKLFRLLENKYPYKVTSNDYLNITLLLRRMKKYRLSDSLTEVLKTTSFAGEPILNEPRVAFLEKSKLLDTEVKGVENIEFRNNNAHFLPVKSRLDNQWWYHERKFIKAGLLSSLDLATGNPYSKVMKANNWNDSIKVEGKILDNQYLNRNFELSYIDSAGTFYVTTNHRLVNDSDEFLLDIFRFYKSPDVGKYVLESMNKFKWQYNMSSLVMNNSENKGLYCSDALGGFGKSDVYVCNIEKDQEGMAKITNSINLGETANTLLPEFDPVFLNDNLIAFASEGHVGFGGSDIYFYDLESYKLINAGKGINSANNEYGIRYEDGYLYWSMDDYHGKSEIKRVKLSINPINQVLNLSPTTKKDYNDHHQYDENSLNSDGAFDTSNNVLSEQTEPRHKIVLNEDLEPGINFLLLPDSIRLVLAREVSDTASYQDFRLHNLLYPENGIVCEARHEIELKIIIEILKRRPDWLIDIRSYTDSRGSKSFNLDLSQKRADLLKDILVSYGVKIDQIRSKGLGESYLLNHCKNGVDCSDAEHRRNRRTVIRFQRKTTF